jgi:hypothetical protein
MKAEATVLSMLSRQQSEITAIPETGSLDAEAASSYVVHDTQVGIEFEVAQPPPESDLHFLAQSLIPRLHVQHPDLFDLASDFPKSDRARKPYSLIEISCFC